MAADISRSSATETRAQVGIDLLRHLQGPQAPTVEGQPVLLELDPLDWCRQERRILSSVGDDSSSADQQVKDAVKVLDKELQCLCILSLQHHGVDEIWKYFVKVMELLVPLKVYVLSLPECQHYLQRIIAYTEDNPDRFRPLRLSESLKKLFPELLKHLKHPTKPKHNYCTPVPPARSATPELRKSPRHKPRPPHRSLLLPDGTNPFLLDRPGEEGKFDAADKSLTFGDLRQSIAVVGREAAQRESVWNSSAGFLLKAFEADLPDDPKLLPRVRRPLSSIDEGQQAKTIMDDAMRASSQAAGQALPDGPMTAREAVAYFAELYHRGKIRHMYFNIVDQTRWSPYELTAVPRQKINPDHYVFSTFGVLSVSRHQPCEVLSLGEWFRQAVLHKAISSIPFFKYYLLRRYFDGWVAVRRRAEYEKRHREIGLTILRAVPNYNSAFLSVSKLLQELTSISFLPLSKEVCYDIGSWRNAVNYNNIQSEKLLERFYMHCRGQVEHARREQLDKLAFWEKQVGNKAILNHFNSTKESLHISNKKQKNREDNLKQCRAETNRLGNFVKLVDQLILAQLLYIIKASVHDFIYAVLQDSSHNKTEAVFKCALHFNEQGNLAITPTRAEFTEVIIQALHDLPQILCDGSYGIDAEYLITDRVDSMRPETRYTTITATSKTKASLPHSSVPKPPTSQKHVRLTAAELKSHTARSEDLSLNTPEKRKSNYPSKADDDLLVRTPNLALPMIDEFELVGTGYLGRYAPLTSTNVSQILQIDPEHQRVMSEGDTILDTAFAEVEAFVLENSWFDEIEDYCTNWNVEAKLAWKGAQAFHIEDYNPREQASIVEQQLGTIRGWTERIKNFEKHFQSTNQVLLVDCSHIHNVMVPKLNNIYKDIIEFVADESFKLAGGFIEDMKRIVQNMKNKKSEISAFAQYAKQVSQYKTNTGAYQQKVEYIKSLFEVVRMSYRQLSTDEERLENQVIHQWETFLGQMQEASEFINTQTPIMTMNLELDHEVLMAEAERLGEAATSGKFLNPEENPTDMLVDMRKLRDQFYVVRRKLEQASKWREAIAGKGYELGFLQEIGDVMEIRQELWKYVEVSSHAIKDWKAQLFKKMNTQKALDKITEWLAIATQMKNYLPAGDLVLAYWFTSLEDFKKDLPLLHKMASDALKPPHWRAIFVGMGETYEEDWEFTVEELLAYNLAAHPTLIDAIFSRARAEYRLEQRLNRIERLWTSNDVYFKLAKHIPDSVYNADKLLTEQRRGLGGERNRASSRQTPVVPAPKGMDTTYDDLYILIETEELQYLLEDSQVGLQQILSSPYVAGFRSSTQSLHYKLREVDELLQLWTNCQSKWVYLMKLFEDPKLYSSMSAQAFAFEGVHSQMKDIQKSVLADPGVFSITSHVRGEKGYKTIQGDNLRRMFTDMTKTQETILKDFSSAIEKLRLSFPRLYFVTDEELINMMSVIRSPQHFIPVAKRCFPSLDTMRFELPTDFQTSANIALDYQLNGDKLEAVRVFGEHDECITLLQRVESVHNGPTWLGQLERQLKLTMVSQLQNCLLDQLSNDNPDLISVLEEVATVEERKHQTEALEGLKLAVSLPIHLTKEATHWEHRLMRFPMQCLLTAEQILWTHRMTQALRTAKGCRAAITAIRDTLQQKVERVCLVMKENSSLLYTRVEHSRMRLSLVLRSLIQCYIQLINQTDKLLLADISCLNCFDWLSVLRYSMEISPLTRAKTFVQVIEEKLDPPVPKERTLRVAADIGGPRVRTPLTPLGRRYASHVSAEEILERQKTSIEIVSTYMFGTLQVQQLDASYRFDHEYQGPKCPLISTGLTERAQYSLMMAMKDYRLGTLIGPQSTGKTDTILSLAQTLGTCVFPITCSSQMGLGNLQRVLSGVIQSGCWAIFDNSDRLSIELMSVAAQQLQIISQSLRTLRYSTAYEYTSRGFPQTEQPTKTGRRNSLNTLHSLHQDADSVSRNADPFKHLTRINSFIPDREDTMMSSLAEPERQRRHSIGGESILNGTDVYRQTPPPSLFYDKLPSRKAAYEEQRAQDLRHLVSEPVSYMPCFLGNIMYCGHLLPARDNSACFMVFNSDSLRYQQMPHSLRTLMRPCAMIAPDKRVIAQTFLYSWGYADSPTLSDKLMLFIRLCERNLSTFRLTLKTLLLILQLSVERLYNPSLSPEFQEDPADPVEADGFALPKPDKYEESLVFGLSAILLARFESDADHAVFRDVVRDVFPLCSDLAPARHHAELVQAIKDQLKTDAMQQTPELVEKILQLHSALQQNSSVIIAGAAGSGKTVLYRTLSLALNKLHSRKVGPSVITEDIQPTKAMATLRQNVPKSEIDNEQLLKSLEAREKSQLAKKWGNVSRSFARLGSLHKLVTDSAPEVVYPKVHLLSLCPSAMSAEELFGDADEEGVWKNGLLTHLLQNINRHVCSAETFTQIYNEKKNKNGIEQPSVIDNWMVLDGDLSAHWVDNLSSMMDSNKKLTLANSESITNTNFTSLIFETGTLHDASPSSVARCSVIHCSHSLTHWKSLISSWMLQARHKWILNTGSLKMLNQMITETFEPTLKFIQSDLEPALDAHLTDRHGSYRNSVWGVHEVQTFLTIITALLNKHLLREAAGAGDTSLAAGMSFGEGGLSESLNSSSGGGRSQSTSTSRSVVDEDYATHQNLVQCIFVYSYIWGFGGHLSDSSRFKFDQYAKEALYRCSNSVTLPRTGSVYDLFVDVKEGTLSKLQDKPPERLRSIPANYAVTSDIERIFHIVELLISAHNHVLLTGASGVGKTALVTNMLMTRQHYTKIAMSPGLSSAHFQNTIITRLQDLRQKTLFSLGPQGVGVKPAQRHMFFVDDLSTAAPVSADNKTQPCLEVLREIISHKITYDRRRQVFEDSKNATFMMACSTPGYAGSGFGVNAHSLSDRLIRQVAVINFFSLTDDGMHSLYGRTLQTWLEEFPSYAIEHHYEFAKAMMQGILDIYKLMKDKFRATPAHAHYVFTLHDIGHIIEGMLLLSPRKTKSKPRRARAKKDNATTASNVQSLFGGMLPGGKVSKDKFRSLSVKDSKDTKNQSADAALPMMPVLVRLWCHEVSRTLADRLLTRDDDTWFKKTLRDLVEKHFCTASPDWLDSHAASKHMRAVLEDRQRFEKTNKEAMKGTPLPFGHALGDDGESDDSELSDGSMTEVTTDVVTPFSERDLDADSFMEEHGVQSENRAGNKRARDDNEESEDEEEAYQGAITPFTETTVNLPDVPITPEQDDEKPTFDDYHHSDGHFNMMYDKRGRSSSDESDNSDTQTGAVDERSEVTGRAPSPHAGDVPSMVGVSLSDDMTNFTSLTPVTWETRSVFTTESRRTTNSQAVSDLTSEIASAADLSRPTLRAHAPTAVQQAAAQQQAAAGGLIKKRRSLHRRSDSKRGVTFKMGLIADKEVQEEYKGALMNFEEIRSVSDDLTEIVFSKYYISAYADFVGMNSERGYAQYTESQVGEALEACLHIYNQHTHRNLRLVFFREAVRHATRISRILSFVGAHALLLGLPHSAGRTTLIRLATHIGHCKLSEVKPLETEEKTLTDFKSKVLQSSHMAGVNGRATILYIHSGVPECVLRDVCCLMSDGQYPQLYSDADMQNMATAMTPGQVQTKKLDKIELSFERYLKKVRQNLHIFISLDISTSRSMDTYKLLQRYPQLVTKAMHVDCYKPWSFETYQYVARKWLVTSQAPDKVNWDRTLYMEQLGCISKAMAYVHKTSEQAVVQLHCHNTELPAHKMYSPLTFQEFYLLCNHVAATIHRRAESRVKVLKQVHDKVDEAFTSIRNQEAEANRLEPTLQRSSTNVLELRASVEHCREKYIEALQMTKDCEEKLEELKKPLMHLRGEAEAEFDKVNVTYYAAMAAINSLDQKDLEELKSYRKPPRAIHIVGEALCIMFNQPTTDWETAQQLMFSKNFFQDMEFYDKSHLSPKIYKTLNKLCTTPEFQPEAIEKGSKAASAICAWIHSVYKYAEIYKRIAPKLAKLMEAEAEVTKMQAELGQKRIHATKTKKELEDLIEEHKEASRRARAIEQKYQAMRRRISEAKEVMANMDLQIKIWRSELVEAEIQIDCAPGDAMLVAAICSYQGPMDAHMREQLTNDWRLRCHLNEFDPKNYIEPTLSKVCTTGHITDVPSANDKMRNGIPSPDGSRKASKSPRRPVAIRDDFSLEAILSDFTEVSGWVRGGLGHDIHKLHNTLIMRTCAKTHINYWPVLVDPDNQAESVLRITNSSRSDAANVTDMPKDTQTELALTPNGVLPPVSPAAHRDNMAATTTGTSETDSQSVRSQMLSHSTRNPSLSARRSSSNELPPVQLVKQLSEDEMSELGNLLKPDREIERPADNLWVVKATDSKLVKYIINAVVHGVVVLVTHTEQRALPEVLGNVIYKNYEKEAGNNSRMSVTVKDFTYFVHSNFSLYLSINSALAVRGDDTRRVPFGHCNLIDLSHSQQAQVDCLLDDIMRIEKPDYEAQARSIEGGVLHHKQELNAEQELIQNKILTGAEAVLDDKTMLSTLQQCHLSIARNSQILEETLYLSNQLQQKRESYISVVMNAAMMYDVIGHMTLVSPYYSLSFERYQSLCRSTVQSRHRGKGVTGAPKARCQELIDAITEKVFQLMKSFLFEADWQLFALLVTIQRMSAGKAFSPEELHIFVNDVKHRKLMSAANGKEKPQWIDHESWLSCHKLEERLSCFAGLTDSLTSRTEEWREYFGGKMSVISRVPGDSLNLSLFQKSILWRVIQPDRLSEVVENLLLTELGPSVVHCAPLSPHELLSAELQSRPVILVEPAPPLAQDKTEPGYPSCDPCELVKTLLPSPDLSHRVTVLSFGAGVTMADMAKVLGQCMKSGVWLILHNCHLAPHWSEEVLQIFERIQDIKEVVYEKTENRNKKVPVIPYETLNPGVSPHFRLWFTTQHHTQGGRLLPGAMIWQSTRYVVEQRRSYQHRLSSVYKHCLATLSKSQQTNPTVKMLTSELVLPLSILHCQLLQRRRYDIAAFESAPHWSVNDLNTVLSNMANVLNKCNGADKLSDFVLSVYQPYCTSDEDSLVVDAIIRNTLRTRAELEEKEVELNARGSQAVLATLVPDSAHCSPVDVITRIHSLLTDDSSVLSLTDSAALHLSRMRSRNVNSLLLEMSGHIDLIGSSTRHQDMFERVDVLLSGWESVLHALPELSYTPDDELNPVQRYLYSQVEAYKRLVQVLLKDSELLHGVARTEFSCCNLSLEMIYQLYMGKVPNKWRQLRGGSALTLMQWKADLEMAFNLLIKYIDKDTKPLSFNLSAFMDPGLFIEALLVQHSRTHYQDVNDLELHCQFLPMGYLPTSPPATGCYISGLQVHNALWDTSTSSIKAFDVNDVSLSNELPLLHLLPRVRESQSDQTTPTFRCRLLCTEDDVISNTTTHVLKVQVPVETESDYRVLIERRVYISSRIHNAFSTTNQ